MENLTQKPLICLGEWEINNASTVAGAPDKVTTETHKLPSGSWETIGYVNGKPICSSATRARQQTIIDVRQMLAENGHYVTIQLAPEMSARMPKRSNRKAA